MGGKNGRTAVCYGTEKYQWAAKNGRTAVCYGAEKYQWPAKKGRERERRGK